MSAALSPVFPQLPPEVTEHIVSNLDGNDVACTFRGINKAAAQQFPADKGYTKIRLSQPVPPHAFAARWSASGATRDLTLEQRRKLLSLTAASGVMANLKVALDAVGLVHCPHEQKNLLGAAVAAGHPTIVVCLLELWPNIKLEKGASDIIMKAAKAGHQAVCQVLLDNGFKWKLELVTAALSGGHPGLADWLLQRRPKGPIGPSDSLVPLGKDWRRKVLRAAAAGCGLLALQSLIQRCDGGKGLFTEMLKDELLWAAADSHTADWQTKVEFLETLDWEPSSPADWAQRLSTCPDPDVRLAWMLGKGHDASGDYESALENSKGAVAELLLQNELMYPDYVAVLAAREGWLEVLKLLQRRGCPIDAASIGEFAVRNGYLPVLAWAVEELDAPVQYLANTAAEAGHVEVLQWLWDHDAEFDADEVALNAALTGNLPVLQWAVEELDASMEDPVLIRTARRSGSLELLAWLREHGRPWGAEAFGYAAAVGCEATLERMVEKEGCPMPVDGKPYVEAARAGDLATLRCMARLGCPWGPASGAESVFIACLEHWECIPLPVFRLLVELDCPVDWAAAVAVASNAPNVTAEVRAWVAEEAEEATRAQRRQQTGPAGRKRQLQEEQRQKHDAHAERRQKRTG
ncbi:hypothetical protein GPECTOR_5g264 [Gonium pectorale]|uniref:Uncharacterized protein n=1 Tax=Gonium pectorale TaxID=33097 RepID=A0A150GW98_GONPE|nr:hypothetical protein GPECTOR_5g264 [Gonium pectorale]|eukprot:KXZ54167.1 hypothetical protein GPECTOR_5g264 [Gonium pectorale]